MNWSARILLLAGLLCTTPAISADAEDCADRADRLRRSARDAADTAETLRSRGARISDVHSALEDVETRLARAKSACGMRSAAVPARSPRVTEQQALRQVDEWTERMKRTDPRYLQVEQVLLKHVELVTKGLPPEFWLPALQLMYAAVSDAAPAEPARPRQRF